MFQWKECDLHANLLRYFEYSIKIIIERSCCYYFELTVFYSTAAKITNGVWLSRQALDICRRCDDGGFNFYRIWNGKEGGGDWEFVVTS